MPAARTRTAEAATETVDALAVPSAVPAPAPAAALACPAGHEGHAAAAKFCNLCGRQLVRPAPPAERPDMFLSALAGAGAARQGAVSWEPGVTVTSPAAEQWGREPMHHPLVTAALMQGNDAEAQRLASQVAREYAGRAASGRDVTGPRRGSAWMRPDELAREYEKTLGASMVPSESMLPRGSAVTTRPLSAAERGAAEFTWGVQPGGGPATAVCTSGHEMAAEDSACTVCRSPAFDASAPDMPLPPPLPYPGSFHGR